MDAYWEDDDTDEMLENAFDKWHRRLTNAGVIKPSKTIVACEEIVGGASVARQISIAAQCAHFGEDRWAERARERAGYE